MRISRVVAAVGIAAVLALTGCTSAPDEPLPVPTSNKTAEPTPTPTPEYTPGVDPEADVEAAIKTYEAYVEASNELVLADRTTWDPVLDLLVDPYKTDSIASYDELALDGYELRGDAATLSAEATKVQQSIINLHVCTDFSQTATLDATGTRVGAAEDYGTKSMNVILQSNETASYGWSIAHLGWSDLTC